MRVRVRHQTDYHYSTQVSQAVNQLCLTPRTTSTQTCLSSSMDIHPKPDTIESTLDFYGNSVSRFNLDKPHRDCSIIVTSVVDTNDTVIPLPDSAAANHVRTLITSKSSTTDLMAHDSLLPSIYVPQTPEINGILSELPNLKAPVLEFAQALMNWIFKNFEYDSNFSTLVTPITEVLKERRGVCQDFAHLAIAILRHVGVPARYVSGYLETQPPPGQEKLRGSDASHAWYSVYDPAEGWFDFDPTNDKRPDQQYVTTAWGRDYADVAPLRGIVYGGGQTILEVAVDVDRIPKGLSAVSN